MLSFPWQHYPGLNPALNPLGGSGGDNRGLIEDRTVKQMNGLGYQEGKASGKGAEARWVGPWVLLMQKKWALRWLRMLHILATLRAVYVLLR